MARRKKVEKKVLTKEEFLELQLFHQGFEAQKQLIVNRQLELKLLEKEHDIITYKLEETKRKHSATAIELDKIREGLKEYAKKREGIVEPIKERLELPDKFGYDELTMEIIDDI
jgi:hypothetical protein